MDEIGQKNIVLVCTCAIVICFHLAYKFRTNRKLFNILIGIGLFISLCMTKFLRDWEKENKVDYNLVLFLYILLDIIIFSFIIYRFVAFRRLLSGGGVSSSVSSSGSASSSGGVSSSGSLLEELKQQDILFRAADSPVGLKIANQIKDKAVNYVLNKLGFMKNFI